MGASLPPRNNPYKEHGLVEGIRLALEVHAPSGIERHITQVEEVVEEAVGVQVPIVKLKHRPLPAGARVVASYSRRGAPFSFETSVTGHSPDGTIAYLRLPSEFRDGERRQDFRLETALQPYCIFRLIVEPAAPDGEVTLAGTIVDLSAGGLCISTRARAKAGEWLGIQVTLPDEGDLVVRVRVLDVKEPERGGTNRHLHCMFVGATASDRDRIARFLVKQQLRLRRSGRL